MRTMILYYNTNSYYFPYIHDSNIKCFGVYKKISKIHSIMRKIPVVAGLTYGEWTKELKKCDKVIVFDNVFDINLARYLKRNFKGGIYVYSWNTAITKEKRFNLLNAQKYFPVYSFDKVDCKKMGLIYAPMVYSMDVVEAIVKCNFIKKYDVVFLGWDKGRREELYELYLILKKMNFNCYFLIRDSKKQSIHDDFKITNENTEYEEYLKLLNASKVIIDIQQKGQEGLTIRILEAMFFEKKIITNKQDIDTYDFYDSNNIFILGKDNIDDIGKFINTSYRKVPIEVEKKYDLKYWVDEYFHK